MEGAQGVRGFSGFERDMKQAISTFLVMIFTFCAGIAGAQGTWIQIEAHSELSVAQERARAFSANLNDVNGFRLSSGWYAIALGPYDENGAIARLGRLRSQRAIPGDSFLVDSTAYGRQFWPVGANTLNAPAVTTEDPDPTVTPAPGIAPEGPLLTVVEPEETRREALQSENRLSRQEKFDLQVALQWFGFYDGAIDASFGRGTRSSMAAWQESKGYEPTGILTTRQRAELTGDYRAVLASLGLRVVRDDVAGIEVEMPMAMVGFDRYEPPFAHYVSKDDSGVRVLLISQTGTEATLLGLYDIMQTLEIVPLNGERNRRNDRFTLTGQNDRITSYTHAVLRDGAVKGFTLIWPTGDDPRREVTLKAMRDSFATIDGVVLPDTYGDGALDQSVDLISGLKIRRPEQSRSGFYIDSRGSVLTTLDAVDTCARITLDHAYEAEVVATDADLGLALLRPSTALAPLNYARFQPGIPRLQSEVAVAGYSFQGMLSSPTLTFGKLSDVRGLRGEENVKRLAVNTSPGDAGGPVFDTSGSVLGMLLPTTSLDGKRLPDDVGFAADTVAIAEFLSANGMSAAASDGRQQLTPEDLTRLAADLTVLVSCWAE